MCPHTIPFLRNKRFTGRDAILQELHRKFFTDQDCLKLAVTGLGGIGKTQVALEFAYQVKGLHPEYSIFWISAVSSSTFEQSIHQIAETCSVQKSTEAEDVKISVMRYLNSEAAGKWLLVVDNADDLGILSQSHDESSTSNSLSRYLPRKDESLLLFTTRHREAASSLAKSDVVELQDMNRQEGREFLTRSLIRKNHTEDQESVNELLEALMDLPLAITQAAAYLNRNTHMSISDYLRLLKSTDQDQVNLLSRNFCDDTRYDGSENAVARTWLVSFVQIKKHDAAAADVLAYLSLLEPKAIPKSLIPLLETEEQLTYAINTLCSYSFITQREKSDFYDMHRLVHLAAKVWTQRQGMRRKSCEAITGYLATTLPCVGYENLNKWRTYYPHVSRVLDNDETRDTKEKFKVCFEVGFFLTYDGQIQEALRWLLIAKDWYEAHLVEADPKLLEFQSVLACAYRSNGEIGDAISLLEHAAKGCKGLEDEHRSRLNVERTLATAYTADGQASKALRLLENIVATESKTLLESDRSRLESQHLLAEAYLADSQVGKALTLLENVVAIKSKTLLESHPSRLESQHVLAEAYLADSQVGKALLLLENVVAIESTTLLENDPSRLTSQHALAEAYLANSQADEAVLLLEHIQAIDQKTLKEDDSARLATQSTLAEAYEAKGQMDEALLVRQHIDRVKSALPDRVHE